MTTLYHILRYSGWRDWLKLAGLFLLLIGGGGAYYLNYYDEETLLGYGPGSYDGTRNQIIIIPTEGPLKPLQMDLF